MALFPEFLNAQTIAIFLVFILVVFLLYRLFRVAIKAAIAGAAGFMFPWVVSYFSLPFPITPTLETSLHFALLAVGLLLAYEFFHFIVFVVKIVSLPFKFIIGKADKKEIHRLREEVRDIEKEKRRK